MEAPKRNEERFIKRYLDERLSNSLEGVEVYSDRDYLEFALRVGVVTP